MKKIKGIAAVLGISLMLGLAGCGGNKDSEVASDTDAVAVNEEETTTEEETTEEATTEKATTEKAATEKETTEATTEVVEEKNTEAPKPQATEAPATTQAVATEAPVTTEAATEAPQVETTEIVPNCVEGGYDVLDANGNVISHIPGEGPVGE